MNYENPLIVQGDRTLLLDVHAPLAEECRNALIPFAERKALFENLAGVERVVTQDTLSYAKVLRELKPDYVVHGNDWCDGFQKPIRQEVCEVLAEYGGKLVEYPYSNNPQYKELDAAHRAEAAMPDVRRGRLRKLINMKGLVTAMEAHSGKRNYRSDCGEDYCAPGWQDLSV